MSLHRQRVHPVEVPGCFGCKVSQVGFAPSATPSRRGGAFAAKNVALEQQWHRDMDAYARLRADGLQPTQIDGAHVLEREATTPIQVEYGLTSPLAKAESAGYIGADGTVNA